MIRAILGLILLIAVSGVIGQQGFVFEGESRRRRAIADNEAVSGTPRANPSAIDTIFQIPITVLQGTSAAAQSFYPNNGDTINKVFNIPVQALHAVGNLIKDRYPPEYRSIDQNTREDQKHKRLERRRELEIQQPRQQLEETEHIQEVRRLKRQQPSLNREEAEGRTHHSAWTNAFVDLLGGHGGLFGGHGGHFGGHGGLHGGHNHGNLFGGHQKKKKKKKKPHGGHFQQLGSHNHGHGSHGSHFANHGSHFGSHGALGSHYEVTENIDDIAPQQGFFSWFQPYRQPEPIQNKIAPGFIDRSSA